MLWEETLERFREALRAEVRKRWGHIGEIEERAGLRLGGLSDFYSGRKKNEISDLLRALDALEIDYGSFFARALDFHGLPEDYLAQLEVGAEKDDVKIARLERATYQLEGKTPPPVDALADASDVERQIAAVIRCKRREQERRLRETRAYGTHAFAHSYLEHLEILRYDAPDEAAKLTAMVMFGLIPRLPAPQSERLELHCKALGIFGSARRVRGRLASSARAYRLALELSRRGRLLGSTAEVLQRASYLLRDFGNFDRALAYLSEALILHAELGSESGIGKALVGRGMMLSYKGDYHRAIATLNQAIERLASSSEARYLRSAYQYLAYAQEHLGNLEASEYNLQAAENLSAPATKHEQGKLIWLRGAQALRRGAYKDSEGLLRTARSLLAEAESPGQEALVSLDLLDALLCQGQLVEACELAQSTVHLLEAFANNRLASQTIIKLIRPALAGRLSRSVVAEVRTSLKAIVGPRPSASERL